MTEDRPEPSHHIDRRAFLGTAARGAAIAWSAPILTTVTASAARAQTVSPKDFSYVALCYSCSGGTRRCCVKFDLDDDGFPMSCEEDNFQTPKCSFPYDDTDSNCADCGLFRVSSPDGGKTIIVTFAPGAPPKCTFVVGQGLGKCGNPPVTGECVPAALSPDRRTATFAMCGV